jgi:hypothetical protein
VTNEQRASIVFKSAYSKEQALFLEHVAALTEMDFQRFVQSSLESMESDIKWVIFDDGLSNRGIYGFDSEEAFAEKASVPVYTVKWSSPKSAARMAAKYMSDHDPCLYENQATDPKHAQPRVAQNVDINRASFTASSPEAMMVLWKHFRSGSSKGKLVRLLNNFSLTHEEAANQFYCRDMLSNWLVECDHLTTKDIGDKLIWKSQEARQVRCGRKYKRIASLLLFTVAAIVILYSYLVHGFNCACVHPPMKQTCRCSFFEWASNRVTALFLLCLFAVLFAVKAFLICRINHVSRSLLSWEQIRTDRAEAAQAPRQAVCMLAEIQWILQPFVEGKNDIDFNCKFVRAKGNTSKEKIFNLLTDLS